MSQAERVPLRKVVVGVGNPLRRDDGVGVWVARRLQGTSGWVAIPAGLAVENVLGKLETLAPQLLLVVDAAELGLPAGEFRRLPWEWRGRMFTSTHGLPLEFLFARLSGLTGELVLVGVQPEELDWGEGLSPPVAAGAQRLVELLRSGRWQDIPTAAGSP
ncbi:MAG TPA: hydrogenase 3 maturation endopeptidase HyCI [Candidatus Acetothermia bacterium]|nr:hydrogenase 3 maturation endopeptidase HyCI [Candidatus Acetothermia bacterium]